MILMTELNEDVQYVVEEVEGKKQYHIEGVWMQGDIGNRNGRRYPVAVLEKEVTRYNEQYISKNNRSQVEITANNTIIIDCYNANPSSMHSALESFLMIEADNKIAIIGDMLELGADTKEEHDKIIKYCKENEINYLVVGEYFSKSEVNPNIRFASTTELLDYFNITPLKNNLILLKGSRGIALEKLLPAL